jgi:hypothetical protein
MIMQSITKKAKMEAALARLKKEIAQLEKSESYKNEQSLIRGLEKLLNKFGKTKAELIAYLSDGKTTKITAKKAESTNTRKRRKLKIYKNPLTNETIETRGGNHKVLKAWKAQYPTQNIEEWYIEER